LTNLCPAVGHDLLYAYGRIATLKMRLLSRADIDRLLGAHDVAELGRILTELTFTSSIDQGLADPDAMLGALATWIRQEIMAMVPETESSVFDILWLEGDGPLLAYLLKRQHQLTSSISIEPTPLFTAHPVLAWKAFAERGNVLGLPPSAGEILRAVRSLAPPSPAAIDLIVARWVASEQLAIARAAKNTEILRFTQRSVDLRNIRSALRMLDATREERASQILPGGTIQREMFLGTRETIASGIERAGMSATLADVVHGEDEGERLEQELGSALAADLTSLWNIPLTMEPVFAFAAIALSQITLLRTVLLAKRSGLSPQELKRILPPFLPATHFFL
jgi:vacuolar-type H+-ATPase subunit C/Vma6